MLSFLLCLACDHPQILILPLVLHGAHKRPLLVIFILVSDLLRILYLLGFLLCGCLGPLTLIFLSPVILQVVVLLVLLEIRFSQAEPSKLGGLIRVVPVEVTHHDLFLVGLQ